VDEEERTPYREGIPDDPLRGDASADETVALLSAGERANPSLRGGRHFEDPFVVGLGQLRSLLEAHGGREGDDRHVDLMAVEQAQARVWVVHFEVGLERTLSKV
jgi:hypothetical protein